MVRVYCDEAFQLSFDQYHSPQHMRDQLELVRQPVLQLLRGRLTSA
jgi:hypothetical protein